MDRVSQLKQFLEIEPDDSFLQHALALEYVKAGDDKAAQILFERLLGREPSYVGSYYHLAKIHERAANIPLAIEWYEKGMKAAAEERNVHALNELRAAHENLTE